MFTAKDETVTNFKNTAYEAGDELMSAANKAGRKVRNIVHTASDEIVHASEKVAGEIRTNPVRSSLIALGLGVVLGALLRR